MALAGLTFTKTALDNLETIPHKIRGRLIKKGKALINEPHPRGSKKLEKCTAEDNESVYRVRSGDYRILYLVRTNSRALKLSMYPFSQGEPGSMKAVRAPTAVIHRRTASATNSGPLSDLT